MMKQKDAKFLLAICAAAISFMIVLWLVPHTPVPVYRFLQDGTGFLVVNLSHLLGLSADYDPSNFYFSVAGFTMQLLEECVALHYHAILTLAILLTPQQLLRRKLGAVVCCNGALVFFNILRLIFLGIVGAKFPEWFYFVHDFIWQIAFAILTVFLCMAWVQPPGKQSPSRYSLLVYSLAFSALFAFAFNAVKISYLKGIVWLADKVVLLSDYGMAWSARWWLATQNNFVMVRMNGEKVLYSLPNREFSVNLSSDMLGIVLFWGFCAGGSYWLRKRNEVFSMACFGLGFSAGSLLLAFVHMATVVVLGWLLMGDAEMTLGSNFLWMMRGVSVLLPIACWWLVWKHTRRRARGHESVHVLPVARFLN